MPQLDQESQFMKGIPVPVSVKNRAVLVCIAAALLVLFLQGCWQACGIFEKDYAATVNGEKIALKEFEARFKVKMDMVGHPSALNQEEVRRLRTEFLNELVDEKIMVTRARAIRLEVTDQDLENRLEEIKVDYPQGIESYFQGRSEDYQAWKRDMKRRLLLEKLVEKDVNSKITVSDDEVLAFFKANKGYARSEERVKVSQIVLPDKESAKKALKRLKAGQNFAALAKEVSTGPEAAKGGDMGYFPRGALPEDLDKAVFALRPGQVSRILESTYGFHIFKVEKKEKAGPVSFAMAKEQVRADLKKQKEEAAYREWLEKLKSESKIDINQTALGGASKA